ncbi:cell division protein ZipA [Vibrio orientalis CIP 102891 = ATCC 33934]|uniref:Cell division protein ZipA n=1 Tax=Vibrio orientalis CIP 102891 = ATCC 33934 TaxID=675816 RepID=C9QM19_VIBOR|nr:cell division protein ZipA [Vibrio orientalis]EEX93034.1 cell division protein ZipA [Vibrio orientalis CIP 102891 = ATCC 33934]EGU50653.1 cell division protein ZipA [Vibrio orientalis CIP 102891 = ATCC 33934]
MQELRFVLIIVGALAIAALLFHGLWTSKKEGKAKFGSKPLGKLDVDNNDSDVVPERAFAPEDDFEIIKKERKEPGFVEQEEMAADPLIDSYPATDAPEPQAYPEKSTVAEKEQEIELEVPSFSTKSFDEVEEITPVVAESVNEEPAVEPELEVEQEAPLEVIVLNVHCAGEEAFVGTKLFDSMQQNGLIYGEMDIFHRHADLSGTGKVLFSVANMMQPGTLKHNDPAEFTTKGISFFMTMPCFGDAEQNFKLMLKTAQQIADDLGANVLDDARNLMTPNRLDSYRAQIQQFKAAQQA